MALDLEIAGEARSLSEAEYADVLVESAKPPQIKRLRDSHHALARALATGSTPQQASLTTGYSLSRISILQNDPSFKELMEYYRKTNDEAFLDLEGRILALGADFLQELRERLDDDPASFDNEEVRENAKLFMDRAGFAPVSRSLNINKSVGIGERLDYFNRRRKESA
jgi:hypothetical protein